MFCGNVAKSTTKQKCATKAYRYAMSFFKWNVTHTISVVVLGHIWRFIEYSTKLLEWTNFKLWRWWTWMGIFWNQTRQIFIWKDRVLSLCASPAQAPPADSGEIARWGRKGKREHYFPKCTCDKANVSPERHLQKPCSPWKCQTFNLERTPFRPRSSNVFCTNFYFRGSQVTLLPQQRQTYIKCASGVRARGLQGCCELFNSGAFLPDEGKSRPASSSSLGAISESQHAAGHHKLFIFITLWKVCGGSQILVSSSPSLISALPLGPALTPSVPISAGRILQPGIHTERLLWCSVPVSW